MKDQLWDKSVVLLGTRWKPEKKRKKTPLPQTLPNSHSCK